MPLTRILIKKATGKQKSTVLKKTGKNYKNLRKITIKIYKKFMPKFNQYLIENKKPVELVQELEKYEIKKLPLSLAARSKVINKSGGGYASEDWSKASPKFSWTDLPVLF